jgi:3-hydroxybutyryl-CoA dehydratase
MDQLDKLQLGMTAEYSQTISDCDIKTFSGISGDKNPVHMDDEYAQNSIFKKNSSWFHVGKLFFQPFLALSYLEKAVSIFLNH